MNERPFMFYSVYALLEGHFKFTCLKEKLKQPELIVRGLLTGIWRLAALYAPDGCFDYSGEEVIKQAGWLEEWGTPKDVVVALMEAGFVEADDGFTIHNWSKHQPILEERRRKRTAHQASKPPGNSRKFPESAGDSSVGRGGRYSKEGKASAPNGADRKPDPSTWDETP